MTKMLAALQQRLQSARLEGSLPITTRHVTALIRCVLSAIQGPEKWKEAEVLLGQLEQQMGAQEGPELPLTKVAETGLREAEILRACAAKAGPSVFDTLDSAIKAASEVRAWDRQNCNECTHRCP